VVERIVSWVKQNLAVVILGLVVAYLLFKPSTGFPILLSGGSKTFNMMGSPARMESMAVDMGGGVAPQMDVAERKVITKSNFSVLVKDVTDVVEKIKDRVTSLEGYVVNTSINRPEFGESGNIQVRVYRKDLDGFLDFIRGLSVRVVSENISGRDITDQYIDIDERVSQLEKTKLRFEQILERAENVTEIMQVQREILNIQDQIDTYKGRLEYMGKASETVLISIYLSTDELGLPYLPEEPWRPQAIFKRAVRSLATNVQKVGTLAIWSVVYLPIIIVGIIIIRLIKKKKPPLS